MSTTTELLPSLARLDKREQLLAAVVRHRAPGPAIDPDPDYQPRHLRQSDTPG